MSDFNLQEAIDLTNEHFVNALELSEFNFHVSAKEVSANDITKKYKVDLGNDSLILDLTVNDKGEFSLSLPLTQIGASEKPDRAERQANFVIFANLNDFSSHESYVLGNEKEVTPDDNGFTINYTEQADTLKSQGTHSLVGSFVFFMFIESRLVKAEKFEDYINHHSY